MYETMDELVSAVHMFYALGMIVDITFPLLVILVLFNGYDIYSYAKLARNAAIVLVAVLLVSGMARQFYPNAREARSLARELAVRNGVDPELYIQIIDSNGNE